MRMLKQALTVLGAVVVVAMIVALVTPKAVHAIVATAVNVVNTSANPVPTVATDDRAKTAVSLSLGGGPGGDTIPFPDGQTFLEPTFQDVNGPYTVPPGKRLVIDSIYGGVALPAGQVPGLMSTLTTLNGATRGFAMPLQLTTGGQYVYSANHTAYADASTQVKLFVTRSSSSGDGAAFAALYGHLEDAP
jgi:hypothetical protein